MNNMIIRSEVEIQAAINALKARLQEKAINEQCNTPVKEGYEEAVAILSEQRNGFKGIEEHCHSTQSRAIAVLAVDYMRGQCTLDTLCKIPLKKQ